MPRFSIVIPTRQRADTLKFAIETALAQTHPDFEVVVQNNGNDQATNDVVASFASHESCSTVHRTSCRILRTSKPR